MTLVFGIAVASSVSADAFGAFGLALAAYWILLGLNRAVSADPLSIRFAARPAPELREAARDAAGASLVVGLLGGAVLCAAAPAVDEMQSALLPLGLAMPVLLVQDCLRYVAFSEGRGHVAFASDAVWALLTVGGIVALNVSGPTSTAAFLTVWTSAAAIAAVVSMTALSTLPRPSHAIDWARAHVDLVPRLTAETMLVNGAGHVSLYLVGAVAGLAAAGSLRGAVMLMGPLNVVLIGTSLYGTPEGARLAARSTELLARFARLIAAVLAMASIAWTGLLLIVPDRLGELLLGASWNGARDVVLQTGLSMAAVGLTAGAIVGLRARAAARRSLRVGIVMAPLNLIAAVAGAAATGAEGAATGIALATSTGTVVAWRELRAELRAETSIETLQTGAPHGVA